MKASCLVTPLLARLIEFGIWLVVLLKVHDMEFDETNCSQEEDENLDDVRGTQLANAMKKMDVGDIRPREVIDVEDDKNQVLSNSNV